MDKQIKKNRLTIRKKDGYIDKKIERYIYKQIEILIDINRQKLDKKIDRQIYSQIDI